MRINIVSFPEEPEYAQGKYLIRLEEEEHWKDSVDDVVNLVKEALKKEEERR